MNTVGVLELKWVVSMKKHGTYYKQNKSLFWDNFE